MGEIHQPSMGFTHPTSSYKAEAGIVVLPVGTGHARDFSRAWPTPTDNHQSILRERTAASATLQPNPPLSTT
ncbi:hypothetical protein, partial [Pseudomonas sp. Bi70]|uniref:hypothetical protein n=1 Tax=Pseudomonas sp. Bi70 TaxID=2821127 RepID=UPI001E2E54A0